MNIQKDSVRHRLSSAPCLIWLTWVLSCIFLLLLTRSFVTQFMCSEGSVLTKGACGPWSMRALRNPQRTSNKKEALNSVCIYQHLSISEFLFCMFIRKSHMIGPLSAYSTQSTLIAMTAMHRQQICSKGISNRIKFANRRKLPRQSRGSKDTCSNLVHVRNMENETQELRPLTWILCNYKLLKTVCRWGNLEAGEVHCGSTEKSTCTPTSRSHLRVATSLYLYPMG